MLLSNMLNDSNNIDDIFKPIGINKPWFSKTTKHVSMNSCIYFTVTRNIKPHDIIHVFENVLNLGTVYEQYINIVPVFNENYNHVFLKIRWNDSIETANFVNELIVNSSVKIYHNKGYWVCRMNKHPLKARHSKRCLHFASFHCDTSDSEENNVSLQIKEEEEQDVSKERNVLTEEERNVLAEEERNASMEEEEDFYVIKEEIIASE